MFPQAAPLQRAQQRFERLVDATEHSELLRRDNGLWHPRYTREPRNLLAITARLPMAYPRHVHHPLLLIVSD